jgi:hypothetical protein
MEYTLSFSEASKGWTSFFSFKPEVMIGMNSYFYTFKDGNLYRHNVNENRNEFYGQQYNSKVTSVFNAESSTVKNFKTISLNSDAPWYCTLTTDMATGFIDSNYFVLKEGDYFAYIRRNADSVDLNLRSAQGLGKPSVIIATLPAAVRVTFGYTITSIVSVGDIAYRNDNGNLQKLGKIVDTSYVPIVGPIPVGTNGINTITIDTTVTDGHIPLVTDFILFIKNSIAESYGALGYYMQFEIENNSTSRVELFSVGSNLFKSYP